MPSIILDISACIVVSFHPHTSALRKGLFVFVLFLNLYCRGGKSQGGDAGLRREPRPTLPSHCLITPWVGQNYGRGCVMESLCQLGQVMLQSPWEPHLLEEEGGSELTYSVWILCPSRGCEGLEPTCHLSAAISCF